MIERYKIVLCEGDCNSLDYQIYSRLFADKSVIPCGSNSILKVRELKLKEHENVCAITDRDLLSTKEINKLQEKDIFVLEVRAIENLLVIDDAIKAICKAKEIKDPNVNSIKSILFHKYGKRLNKELDVEINENNILEFYNPKKVIDTVALMLNMSKKDYITGFFELLNTNEEIKQGLLDKIEYYMK